MNDFKGIKIGLNLSPNGITLYNNQPKLKFSIIIGLDLMLGSTRNTPTIITPQLLQKIGFFLSENLNSENFKIKGIADNSLTSFSKIEEDVTPLCYDKIENWADLLGYEKSEKKYIRKETLPTVKIDEVAVFNNRKILQKPEDIAGFLYEGHESTGQDQTNIERFYNQVDSRLENINEYSLEMYKKYLDNKKNQENNTIDFHELQASIFQQPVLAKYQYGMVIDVFADINISELENSENQTLELILINPNLKSYFRNDTINSLMDIAEPIITLSSRTDYHFNKVQIDSAKIKYYHGRENYGILRFPTETDSTGATKHLINFESNSKIQQFKANKSTKKDEQYSYGLTATHRLTKSQFNTLFLKDGVVGYNIACSQSNSPYTEFDSTVISLCKRDIKHYKKGKEIDINILPQHKEGAITFDFVQLSTDNNDNIIGHRNTELFTFEGYNLSLPKPGIDNSIISDDIFSGEVIRTKNLDHFLQDHGITPAYSYEDRSLMLSTLYSYLFFIRSIEAVTNYCLPIKSANTYELSLTDIKDIVKTNIPEAGIEYNRPINTPKLLGEKLYPPHKHQVESNTIIVFKSEEINNINKRYFYPPVLSLESAQRLGLTDPLFFKNNTTATESIDLQTEASYIQYTSSFLTNNNIQTPRIHISNKKVQYTPDVRGKILMIYGNDWKTKNSLLKTNNHKKSVQVWEDLLDIRSQLDFKDPFKKFIPRSISVYSDENNKYYIEIQTKRRPKIIEIDDVGVYNINFALSRNNRWVSDESLPKPIEFNPLTVKIVIAKSKPDKPILVSKPLEIKRFTSEKLNRHIFFTFSINQDPGREKLILLSESNQIIDDSMNTPLLHDSPNLGRLLLKDEYPASIFSKTIGDINSNQELEVYPNKFGIKFNIPEYEGKEVVNFNINNNSKLILSTNGLFFLNEKGDKLILSKTLPEKGEIIFDYKSTDNKLELEISFKKNDSQYIIATKKEGVGFFNFVGLPSQNLSKDSLEVKDDNLIMDDNAFIDFLYYNKFYRNTPVSVDKKNMEYFVFRQEPDTKYKVKKYRIKSISKFIHYYPEKEQKDLENISDEFRVVIKNNKKPSVPNIKITPFYHHITKIDTSNKTELRVRNNQLMIEIERSWNEDKLGIIISKYSKLGDNTVRFIYDNEVSALGHDIIKPIKNTDLPENPDIKPFIRTSGFISNEKKAGYNLYLTKYFGEKGEGDYPEPTIKTISKIINNKEYFYDILLLTPFFDVNKNKWIALIGFNNLKDLHDPFVRIVTIRYQEISTHEVFQYSEFTKPIMLTIASQRSIKLREDHTHIYPELKLNGKKYIPRGVFDENESYFYLCFIEHQKKYFSDIDHRKLLEMPQNEEIDLDPDYKYYFQDISMIKKIEKPINISKMSALIFELEVHGRSGTSDIDDPESRIIYMEEFNLR